LNATELLLTVIAEERGRWLRVMLDESIAKCGMEKTSDSSKVM
jgi:hypothetical protein